VKPRESETYDIYLVPPGEDPETCQSWLRMRYRDGRYNLMFEEWVVEVSRWWALGGRGHQLVLGPGSQCASRSVLEVLWRLCWGAQLTEPAPCVAGCCLAGKYCEVVLWP
jgi:hypothetical protein